MLVDQHSARGQYAVVGCGQVIDQDVEVNPAGVLDAGRAGGLEGEPLAVRGWLERDPARIPLHRRAAEQAGPESREHPRLGAVEHHFPDPANDRRIAHLIIMARRTNGPGGNGSRHGRFAGGQPAAV